MNLEKTYWSPDPIRAYKVVQKARFAQDYKPLFMGDIVPWRRIGVTEQAECLSDMCMGYPGRLANCAPSALDYGNPPHFNYPHDGSMCGFYTMGSITRLLEYVHGGQLMDLLFPNRYKLCLRLLCPILAWLNNNERVVIVELSGRVLEGSKGYRAEKQKIVEVLSWRKVRQIVEREAENGYR